MKNLESGQAVPAAFITVLLCNAKRCVPASMKAQIASISMVVVVCSNGIATFVGEGE